MVIVEIIIVMEFPEDIWRLVFSYFHSSYKTPGHLNALLETPAFYFYTKIRQQLHFKKRAIDNSFYISAIISKQNTTNASIRFRRGVAVGKVLEDFESIFRQYRNIDYQDLRGLTYEV